MWKRVMKTRCEFEPLICPTVATLKVGSFNFVIDSLSLLGFAGIGIWVWRKGRFCEVGMGKDWILGGNGVENGERMDSFLFFVLGLLLFLLMGKMDGRIERRGGFWLLKV